MSDDRNGFIPITAFENIEPYFNFKGDFYITQATSVQTLKDKVTDPKKQKTQLTKCEELLNKNKVEGELLYSSGGPD